MITHRKSCQRLKRCFDNNCIQRENQFNDYSMENVNCCFLLLFYFPHQPVQGVNAADTFVVGFRIIVKCQDYFRIVICNVYYRYYENGALKDKYLGKKIRDEYIRKTEANKKYDAVSAEIREIERELERLKTMGSKRRANQ